MLEIVTFSIGIMYTPGPVNLLSLNNGLQKRLSVHIPFSIGVACALTIWFMLMGYAGTTFVSPSVLPYIGILGCGFIFYLAGKIMRSKVDLTAESQPVSLLTFRDGLFMQLLNPKSFMVVFPVTTILFPAADITGAHIAVWSGLLGLLGFGAPTLYAFGGALLSAAINQHGSPKKPHSPALFNLLNKIMGLLLIYVACDMAYHQVYQPLFTS
jgi:threonine/homoserine/homoserine lactone efflux protein